MENRYESMQLGAVPYQHMLRYGKANALTRLYGERWASAEKGTEERHVNDVLADRAAHQEFFVERELNPVKKEKIKGKAPLDKTYLQEGVPNVNLN